MPSRPVHWKEGMFLQPHHFQAADRHAREAIRAAEEWMRPYPWGLRHLDIGREAIANGIVAVVACDARFKDGTRLSIPEDCEVAPLEIKDELIKAGGVLTVYLAVPARREGQPNVETARTADGPRHWVESTDWADENVDGRPETIEVRRIRCRLLHSRQDHEGYEVLPIARFERSAKADGAPDLDPWFIPPLLGVDAWPSLWRSIQSLHHQIARRVEQLSTLLAKRPLESQTPGDTDRVLKLGLLNGAFSYFHVAAFTRGLPPVLLYSELCRLAGQLSLFTASRRPPDLPPYDHDDLGPAFQAVVASIEASFEGDDKLPYEERPFERIGDRLQVNLEPSWVGGGRSLYLAVDTELKDQDCQELLDRMDMKIGSGSLVEHYFRNRVVGLTLRPVPRPPQKLPPRSGLVYFEIERTSKAWRDVVDANTLAIRLNVEHAKFQGDRVVTVPLILASGTRSTNLQFVLYVL